MKISNATLNRQSIISPLVLAAFNVAGPLSHPYKDIPTRFTSMVTAAQYL